MAVKYNFQMIPGEFKRALKELDGAFLQFGRNEAEFLNPSIKDFISSLLCNQSALAVDLMGTAQRFEQVTRLWELSVSEHGEELLKALLSREETVTTILRSLLPESVVRETVVERFDGYHRRDRSIEAKARVLVLVADRFRTGGTLAIMRTAIGMMLERWKSYAPEFQPALQVLTEIEGTQWKEISLDSDLQDEVKYRLLDEYKQNAWSNDFIALSEHAPGWYHWNEQDKVLAQRAFEAYLDNNLREERSSCTGAEDLGGLHENIKSLGSAFRVDVQDALANLDEAIAEALSEEDDRSGDDGEWRHHQSSSDGNSGEEDEVRRMFGSLIE
jgi:hypothetical protein